jgi:hypothetical protein
MHEERLGRFQKDRSPDHDLPGVSLAGPPRDVPENQRALTPITAASADDLFSVSIADRRSL